MRLVVVGRVYGLGRLGGGHEGSSFRGMGAADKSLPSYGKVDARRVGGNLGFFEPR
ncbi:hypothetical protein GCM10010321_66610 [Streptomyces chartreusis]|nr:hypothetical protein GCM10010321_66610 [Streptomyces chartreusis]